MDETRDHLVPLVYAELRRLAQHYMRGERAEHTLQPTALVNEVYLKLADIDRMQWRDRAHFIGTAATLMRRVLVDHARSHARDKRGGKLSVTSFNDDNVADPGRALDVVALDDALTALADLDPRQSQVVELASSVDSASRRLPTHSTFRRPPSSANGRWPRRGCTISFAIQPDDDPG